jgi:hypothetical protein
MDNKTNYMDTLLAIVTSPIRWIDNIFNIFNGYTQAGYSRFFVWAMILFVLSLFTKFKGEVAIKK